MARATSLESGRVDARSPAIRRIGIDDLKDALARGFDDFKANRSDIFFLCIIYPVISIILVRVAFGKALLPLVFPLLAGFTLIGPVIALGFYELSRRREQGLSSRWADVLGVLRRPSIGAVAALAVLLVAIFAAWLAAAWGLYALTMGGPVPTSVAAFVRDVFATPGGWALIVLGNGVGFLFAVLVLSISVVSFPMLIDRDVDVASAVRTSVRVVAANPVTMAVWGLIVAGALALGCIPLFVGLAVAVPTLGHATWHLYRKAVEA